MSNNIFGINVKWTVWDNNPIVCWEWSGGRASVKMTFPPISVGVIHVNDALVVAIVGSYEEFSSGNLNLYSLDGVFLQSYTAPQLGEESQFGAVEEVGSSIRAVIGYLDNGRWKEVAGTLDLRSGFVDSIHRSY
ncbi:hypothetical protein [Pseudomonas sp. Irchel 3E13]|uniref:hypothetical protein n=1 Tax=Pseudomonas sp. Irchel 3E13 TaxID=2008975 RepID=UPI00117998A2|nr:hypothetical protein [Pseudomonas sp. Irchel 3E13]